MLAIYCKLLNIYVAEIEYEGQAFPGTFNTAEDFLMTQNQHLMAGLWQQQHQKQQI